MHAPKIEEASEVYQDTFRWFALLPDGSRVNLQEALDRQGLVITQGHTDQGRGGLWLVEVGR